MVNINISKPKTPARKVPACGNTWINKYSGKSYTCNAPLGHPGKHAQYDTSYKFLRVEARWK